MRPATTPLRGAVAVIVLLLSLATAAPAAAAEDDTAGAAALLVLVNEERAAEGLVPLIPRDDVIAIAVQWSHVMADAGTLSHNDAYFTRENRARLGASRLGENVAKNVDLLDAHRRLMASPGHRANILDPHFNAVGIGVVLAPTGEYYVTQDFLVATNLVPASATAPAPAPEPGPEAPSSGGTSTSTTAAGGNRRARVAAAPAPPAPPPPAPTTTAAPEPAMAPAPEPEPVLVPAELAAPGETGGGLGPVRPRGQDGKPGLLALLAAAMVAGDLLYLARNRRAIAA